MHLSDCDCEAAWSRFFRAHCDGLFEMALLLSANPNTAEAILVTTLEHVDISAPPRTNDLSELQNTLAIKIVRDAGPASSAGISNAGSMLRSGLRPILQLDRFPRACFVLRFLLGYAISSCAHIVGVEEAGVKALLQTGLIQFHRAVLQQSRRPLAYESRERIAKPSVHSGIDDVEGLDANTQNAEFLGSHPIENHVAREANGD